MLVLWEQLACHPELTFLLHGLGRKMHNSGIITREKTKTQFDFIGVIQTALCTNFGKIQYPSSASGIIYMFV